MHFKFSASGIHNVTNVWIFFAQSGVSAGFAQGICSSMRFSLPRVDSTSKQELYHSMSSLEKDYDPMYVTILSIFLDNNICVTRFKTVYVFIIKHSESLFIYIHMRTKFKSLK